MKHKLTLSGDARNELDEIVRVHLAKSAIRKQSTYDIDVYVKYSDIYGVCY